MNGADFRRDALKEVAAHGEEMGHRLARLEADFARPGKAPVHGEGIGAPVGLDNAGEGRDAILHAIDRAGDPGVPARRGAQEEAHLEGEDARAEIGHRAAGMMHGQRIIQPHLHIFHLHAAIPAHRHARWGKHLPAMLVGNRQRQAAIGKALRRCVHPVAPARSGTDGGGLRGERVAEKLHGSVRLVNGAASLARWSGFEKFCRSGVRTLAIWP